MDCDYYAILRTMIFRYYNHCAFFYFKGEKKNHKMVSFLEMEQRQEALFLSMILFAKFS